jgi:hypothetical protein
MHGIGYGSMWKDLLEIKQFLPAAPPVDLRQWQDPSIGWGLVVPDNDSVSAADKALGKDAKEPFQRLLAARSAPPVLRYRQDGLGVSLRRYYADGSLLSAKRSVIEVSHRTVTHVSKYGMSDKDLDWLAENVSDPNLSLNSIERMVDLRLEPRTPRARQI